MGGVFISIYCSRQRDLKVLIAFSSVVHISLGIVGILTQTFWGFSGFVLLIVAHGFISPLLFFLINFFYDSNHSRSIFILKGSILLNPLFCLFWFFSCFLNIGLPPFISFYSEALIVRSLRFLSYYEWFFLFLILFFTGVYCVLIYSHLSHGSFSNRTHIPFLIPQPFFFFIIIFYVILYPLDFF